MKLLIKKRFTYATIGVYFLLGGIEYGTEEIISQYLYFVDTLRNVVSDNKCIVQGWSQLRMSVAPVIMLLNKKYQ